MDHLVHTHILLGLEQKRALRRLALAHDTSLSSLLRDAIDHYFRVVCGPTPERLRQMARGAVGTLEPPDDAHREDRGLG